MSGGAFHGSGMGGGGGGGGLTVVTTDASLSGTGTVPSPLALALQKDASIAGLGSVASPASLAVQHDASIAGLGSVASPASLAVQHDASLTGLGSVASPLSEVGWWSKGHLKWGGWFPAGASAVITAQATPAPTNTGTVTARNPANTNMLTSLQRIGLVSASSANSVGGERNTAAQYWVGNSAGLGGFVIYYKFAISDAVIVSTANMFVGLAASTSAPTDVLPTTLVNIVGVGCNNGDTHLQLYGANGSTQTRTDLGANFPVNTTNVDVYEVTFTCLPNASSISYTVTRCNTGQTTSGVLSGNNVPVNSTFLTQQFWRSNGGTASAVGIDLITHYFETPQ